MQVAEYGSFYHPVSDGQTVSVRVGRHALRRGLRQIGSQRRMWPPAVVRRGPLTNNLLEMTFVERNQEVQTFPTKAPAQSLAHRVGLGGSHGRPQNSHPQVRQTLVDVLSEDAVAIVDQEAG